MAMYHFRLKSDKKPNGTRVSAIKHVEYINREGTFAKDELWQQKNKFVGDCITTAETPTAFEGIEALLYKTDDFGSIRNSEHGIEVSEQASPTTIAIALVTASEVTGHKPLIIHGSRNFRRKVLEVALAANLPIFFQEPLSQQELDRQQNHKETELSKLAQSNAKKILENMSEAVKEHSATAHLEYINREKAFANRGGCIFHSHRLPKWAHDDPKIFFQAADKYEGVGNRRYREIEFALPNELTTVMQYRQIIDAFIAKHLSDHYYAYAIHNKIGVMSDGQHHPHVHIMFSERLIDDVEKKHERTAENFFKYPLRKNVKASFEERWKRGAPKNRNWAEKSFLTILRADFAQIQNDVLEQNGFSIRVDHRSLKAQKAEAERNGDTFLVRLFSRIPEKYVGIISCYEDDEPKLARLRKFRALRKQHFDLVMRLDALTKDTEELETKDAVQLSSIKAKNLMDAAAQKNMTARQQELRARMFTAIAKVNKWKRVIISYHDAQNQAKLEYMNAAERELWQKYFETLAQKKQLEEFLKNLREPETTDREIVKAHEEVVAGVKSKIFSLFTASLMMKKSVEEIKRRLESAECKKNIVLVTHQILQANAQALKELKRANADLDNAVDELTNAIFQQTQEEPQETFKTREVYDLIRRQFFGLKKEYEKTQASKFALQRRIISPQRALAMAQNIFVGGEFKKLRAAVRQHKKDEQRLARNIAECVQREKIFQANDWKIEPRSIFLQEQYNLTRQKTLLAIEKERLETLKRSLENRQTELEKTCREPDSQKKIDLIAAGILRKNYKFVRQLEEVDARTKLLRERVNHAKEQMETLKLRVALDKPCTRYKLTNPDISSSDSAVSIIADSILHEPHAVQLVARSSGNNLEMDKTWELMSDLDKDDLIHKKIVREF